MRPGGGGGGRPLRVLPGQRIPVDGVVVEGSPSVDTAKITGGVSSCRCDPGGPGPVRLHQHLRHSHHSGGERICFLHRGQDFDLMESATEGKSATESLITRFARYHTPAWWLAL